MISPYIAAAQQQINALRGIACKLQPFSHGLEFKGIAPLALYCTWPIVIFCESYQEKLNDFFCSQSSSNFNAMPKLWIKMLFDNYHLSNYSYIILLKYLNFRNKSRFHLRLSPKEKD